MLESSASVVAFALAASAAFFFWIPAYPRPATVSTAAPAIITAANPPWRFPDDSRLSSSRLSDSRLSDSRLSGSRLSVLRCSGSLSMSDLISPSESLPAPLSLTHCYLQLLSYD